MASGIGGAALATLLSRDCHAESKSLVGLPHFAPRANRVIYLFQSGAPSQMDLFDYKPRLGNLRGRGLADSIRRGQRLTGMPATQERFPVAPSRVTCRRHGQAEAWLGERVPQP